LACTGRNGVAVQHCSRIHPLHHRGKETIHVLFLSGTVISHMGLRMAEVISRPDHSRPGFCRLQTTSSIIGLGFGSSLLILQNFLFFLPSTASKTKRTSTPYLLYSTIFKDHDQHIPNRSPAQTQQSTIHNLNYPFKTHENEYPPKLYTSSKGTEPGR
jgi:hypothetical protein